MIIVPTKTFDEFYSITGIDLVDFYSRVSDFLLNNQMDIINYYSGKTKKLNSESFNLLLKLIKESKGILNELDLNSNILNNMYWWDLQESLQEIHHSLEKINNVSLFLRGNTENKQGTVINQQTSFDETVETILNDKFSKSNYQNESQDVLISNDIIEEDYTPDGGNILKIIANQNNPVFQVTSILDNDIEGKKLYGYDLNKKITFTDGDLEVLTPDDTILQTIGILVSLLKKNNPEFPQDGIDSSLLVGSNVGSLTFPTILRQLVRVFKTDDTISNFSVTDIRRVEDRLYMDFEVNTIYGESLKTTGEY